MNNETDGLGIRWSRTAGDLLFGVGYPDRWLQAKLFCPTRITSIIERQQLGAGFTGRKVERVREVDAIATMAERCLNFLAVLHGDSRQRDQVRQAVEDLVLRLVGYITQYPLQFQHHRLRNEHIAGREHVGSDTSLRRVVAEVEARKDVGINGAHAWLPSSPRLRRASRLPGSEDRCNREWRPRLRCATKRVS